MTFRKVMSSRAIGAAGGALLTLALMLAVPRDVEGTYENARQVGKRCATCHTTTRPNAETLNETGRFFQMRRTLDGAPGVTPSKAAPVKGASGTGKAAPASKPGAAAKPGGAAPVSAEAAAATFKQMCAPCHGANGEGTQLGKTFKGGPVAAQPEAAVARTIRGGVPNTAMAPFAGTLSAAQIDALARHVLTLAKAH